MNFRFALFDFMYNFVKRKTEQPMMNNRSMQTWWWRPLFSRKQ